MSWKSEFGAEYEVPPEILSSDLIDDSWHNDACPSFRRADDEHHKLWVEHPDPDSRETTGPRFMVMKGDSDEPIYYGDDVTAALAAMQN